MDSDHCFLFASGIAYNVILCIIPISLILFQVLSIVLRSSDTAKQAVFEYIRSSLPIENYGEALHDWIEHQLSYVSNASFLPGIIALLVLLWLSSALFASLRAAINGIFKIPTHHNIALLKLKDFASVFVLSLLLLITLLLAPVISALQRVSEDILPSFLDPFIHSAFSYIIPVFLAVAIFLYLFHVLPHRRISWRVSFVATIVTVTLMEIMKYIFVFYLEKISNLGAVYGAYAFLVAIAFWSYYVALVFTIGAETGKLYRDRHEIR